MLDCSAFILIHGSLASEPFLRHRPSLGMVEDSTYGKKQYSKPSLIDRVVLEFAYPLPESLSLRRLLLRFTRCVIVAGTCVAYASPVLIIILTWSCLESIGMSNTRSLLQLPALPWSSTAITPPKLSLPASFALLSVVSTLTHVFYCAKQHRQQQHSTQAVGLTPDHWKLRPLGEEATLARHRTSSKGASAHAGSSIIHDDSECISPFLAARDTLAHNQPTEQLRAHLTVRHLPQASTQNKERDKIHLQPTPITSPNQHEIAQCFSRLQEVQVLLFGEQHALDWSKSTPRVFENAVFETGRLCGLVGVPSSGEANSIAAVNALLSKLNSALAVQ